MKSITSLAAILLAAWQLVAAATPPSNTASTPTELPSAEPTLNAPSVQGCFSSSGTLTYNSSQVFNSEGKCATDICFSMGKLVAGTTGGQDCWCGDEYPPKSTLANDTDCNIGCTGFPKQACGGLNYWTIYNTGVKIAVENAPDSSSSAGASTTATNTAAATTAAVTVTASSSAETSIAATGGSSSSPNMAGIAAGVVVSIVGVAAIIGGVFFFLRRRRNLEIEQEHRRNAAVNAFINGSKPPSSSGGMSIADARLDPVIAQRRMSDGSIADNQDYSRRILRVTNA